jgi:predicted ATPase
MAGRGAIRRLTLFGRGEDLAALEAAFDQAGGGVPITVLLGGDAGIGKTRLIEEWADRAFAGGARVLRGSCVDLQDTPLPYAAIIDALRAVSSEALEELGPALRAELGALVPEAAAPDLPAAGPTQAGLFGAVLRLVEQLGRDSPLVLVVEDVHWADRSTQDLLRFLVRGLRQTAVMIALTYRSVEMHREQAGRGLLADLQRAPGVVSLELAPLTAGDTAEQLAELAGAPVGPATVRAIHARSEGNPFFSGELLAAGDEALSGGLRDVLLTRVDRLTDDARVVARVAACAGREVDDELLRAARE